MELLLASKSPRRRELIAQLGYKYQIIDNNAPEDFPPHLKAEQIPVFLAEQKANFNKLSLSQNQVAIFADTIVWCEDEVLNKPENYEEANKMLQKLSGKSHQVISGVCLKSHHKKESFFDITTVYFKPLLENEIDYYIKNYKPYDKAGAYGIQEWIGFIGVEKIEGSYFNVVGLPIQKLYQKLLTF
jgi:septum formation protein